MKRTVAVVLLFLILVVSCACGGPETTSKPVQGENSNVSEVSASDSGTTDSTNADSSEAVSDNSGNGDNSSAGASSAVSVVTPPSVQIPEGDVIQSSSTPEDTSSNTKPIAPPVVDPGDIPPTPSAPSTSEPQLPEVTDAKHEALKSTVYYQYSNMNANEKKLYDRLRTSALSYENSTDASDLNLTKEAAMSVMERFRADNPQYFWVSNRTSVSYDPSTGIVSRCILFYSDGTVTDDLSTTVANRNTIKARRSEVEAAVKAIVGKINPAADDYTKEKQIHDYLVDTMKYDSAAANEPMVGNNLKNAFNVYGALIEKKGVCEGYSKAFQYLCYEVGINANQVIGVGHMWNVVKIGGDWYQIDVTWDDPIVNGGTVDWKTYDFFNKTTREMEASGHTPAPDSTLKVPNCTATKYKYNG